MIKSILFVVFLSCYFRLTPATGAAEAGDAIGAVVEVLGKLVSVLSNDKDNCCPAVWKNPQTDAKICIDGTYGTTGCGVGKCNWNGCECQGGCKSINTGVNIAYIRQSTTMFGWTDMLYPNDTCQNLDWWNDRISSLIPITGCIHIYEHFGCQGRDRCMCDGDGQFSLSNIDWDDMISSYKKC